MSREISLRDGGSIAQKKQEKFRQQTCYQKSKKK